MLDANRSVKSDWTFVKAVCKAATSAAVAADAKLVCKAATASANSVKPACNVAWVDSRPGSDPLVLKQKQ